MCDVVNKLRISKGYAACYCIADAVSPICAADGAAAVAVPEFRTEGDLSCV